jgi:sugar lactone lactonase YvrE
MNRVVKITAVLICNAIAVCSVFLYAQILPQSAYIVAQPDSGNPIPVAAELFSYTNNHGVLVSQAGAASSGPIRMGRIFVDEAGTQTGFAFVNASTQTATVILVLRNVSGDEIDRTNIQLPAGAYSSRYVREFFPKAAAGFVGSLTFASDQPVAALTLRENRNSRGEPLYATLPVVDLSISSTDPLIIPHLAAGSGYTTQLVLINKTAERLSGQVRLVGEDGQPLILQLAQSATSEFGYQIEPNGISRVELDSDSGLRVGYAVVSPAPGAVSPAGAEIFQYRTGGQFVTEAGILTAPQTTLARILVDEAGSHTGLAIANAGNQAASVVFTLMNRYGESQATATREISGGGHVSVFAHELFPQLANGYTGLLEIRSTAPIAPVTLKITINARDEMVLTTLPVADVTRAPANTAVIFPHAVFGGGFSTRLIFINPDTSNPTSGRLQFYGSNGAPVSIPVEGVVTAQFTYRFLAGSGGQLLPGNTAKAAKITLLDTSGLETTELTINEGNTVRPVLRIVDTGGAIRDDFMLSFSSSNTDVAIVNDGRVAGRLRGFSTLGISAGGALAVLAATVTDVDSGFGGFEPTGVAQAGTSFYLAATDLHAVVFAASLAHVPQTYAGTPKTPGFKNDFRLAAEFRSPSFLALSRSDGAVYISDAANNVIRKIQPGASGRVETLAGSGAPGSDDGTADAAAFNNPQGIALDNRGRVWVTDSNNHTIRRINLVTGLVETIAGIAGDPGFADGNGAKAKFRSPMGIAIEPESSASQLERYRRQMPPPPLRVLVADSGNDAIRRVYEDGRVETLGAAAFAASSAVGAVYDRPKCCGSDIVGGHRPVLQADDTKPANDPSFRAPVGVAADSFGTIYATQPGSGQVLAMLPNGRIVAAAEANTFHSPRGIAAAENGKLIVADGRLRQIRYGEPQIVSITPDHIRSQGGVKVTIRGRNFAPGTIVVAGGVVISNISAAESNTETISFIAPPLPSGRTTVTVQNRGGLAQAPLLIEPALLAELPGYITTVAGGSTFGGEGTSARTAAINPLGIALDAAGNLLVADFGNNRVRRIDARTNIITSVAGSGYPGTSGDGAPAIAARLSSPNGVAFDPAGNLLISGNSIRKVDAATGIITTVVGEGYGYCGDGGNALNACFNYITGFAVDAEGNLFIADRFNQRVRRVDGTTNIVTTIAGNGQVGYAGDGGDARSASLNEPLAVAVDSARKLLYIADAGNDVVRRVNLDANNVITTVPDNGDALSFPNALAVDAAGSLFISDRGNSRIRKVDIESGIITTIAGLPVVGPYGDGGPATAAYLRDTRGIAVDAGGNLFISEGFVIRRIDAVTQIITTFAGNGQPALIDDGVQAIGSTLSQPSAVTVDPAGNLFITDAGNNRIRRVDAATGIIETFAGGGNPDTDIGDGGPARNAHLSEPRGRAVLDTAGNLYVADRYSYRVRKIDGTTRTIVTIAGSGADESSGDGGPATSAGVLPDDLAVDGRGNLYIAEGESRRIRKVNLSTGIISTVASGAGPIGGLNEQVPATAAGLGAALRIAADASGNVFIADAGNRRVRQLSADARFITTIAGGGTSFVDNMPARSVELLPVAIDVDAAGNLLIVDFGYPVGIRMVSAESGLIRTIAGADIFLELGDNGPATAASFYYPLGVTADRRGNIFIADTENHRIRAIRGPIQ